MTAFKSMRYITYSIFFLFAASIQSQGNINFGILSIEEKEFNTYPKDSAASAVYLYEVGDNYFEVRDGYVWLITKYHAKIKIFTKDGFNAANIKIPIYHSKNRDEKIVSLKALTHNDGVISSVKNEEFFETRLSEKWSERRFTFSNVKEGSILEYMYEMQSPFYYNLTGWKFQTDIPKRYSEFNAKIPGNWVYNRILLGSLELDINEATLEKYCFGIGEEKEAECEVLKYVMKDIPAFKDTEDFMLASSNYRSRLEFELSEYKSFFRGTERYTKSWDDVDSEFRTDKDIGIQLRKKNFFEKQVSNDLLTEGDDITRAKNIFKFVQNHFVWNQEYGLWDNNRVKDAFDERKGNAAEINITLINLLNAAGLKSDMMLMATRNRGLPKKVQPVMSDFNYIVAKVDIDGTSYLLDATEKNNPFGMLPFRCLNYYGRVMDFNDESYWFNIVPEKENRRMVRVQMSLDSSSQSIKGKFVDINSGYLSLTRRDRLDNVSEGEYLKGLEADISSNFSILSHEIKKNIQTKKKLRRALILKLKMWRKVTLFISTLSS